MSSLAHSQKAHAYFPQIINMSVGFFGIQFGFGLQNANVSRIFQTLGADIDNIPILMDSSSINRINYATGNWSLK